MWYRLHYRSPKDNKDQRFWFTGETLRELGDNLLRKNYDLRNFISVHTEKKLDSPKFNWKKYSGAISAPLEGKNLKDKLAEFHNDSKLPPKTQKKKRKSSKVVSKKKVVSKTMPKKASRKKKPNKELEDAIKKQKAFTSGKVPKK